MLKLFISKCNDQAYVRAIFKKLFCSFDHDNGHLILLAYEKLKSSLSPIESIILWLYGFLSRNPR
jgi:hypothetical protein